MLIFQCCLDYELPFFRSGVRSWIAASIPVSVSNLSKGVAVPKTKEFPMPIIAPMSTQAPVPIQTSKASVVAIWAPVLVIVVEVAPVEAIWVPESVLIQAPETMQVFIADGYDEHRQICFPTNKAANLLNMQGVLDKPPGQRNSIKRALSSSHSISSPTFLLLVNSVCLQCRKMTFLLDDCYFPQSYRGFHNYYNSPYHYRGFSGLYNFGDRYGHDGLYGHWGLYDSRDHYGFGGLNVGYRGLYGDCYGYPSWHSGRYGHHFGSRYGQRYGYGW
ncbi:hypothetical protein ASZ78_009870 [Callipepla squamata]|uniref:Uncharacterized protein n=1 Tax=Callipepla squamata TaxID=9009 RepID=A0A226MDC8_CALSU|nr:hypothetical protein ASZ78_009870 [Callipepla squamata]